MAEVAEPGGSKGQAPADTKPIIGFLVAGHPLGARGTCPVLAGCGTAPANGQRRHLSLVATD